MLPVSFLNPSYLIALLLVALPVVIHLINRRRARVRKFAAMDLLLRCDRRMATRFDLKQLLLLLVRICIIVFLVLAIARPLLRHPSTLVAAEGPPTSLAIVIDASYSMKSIHKQKTAFDRAVDDARRIVNRLRRIDNACLLAGEQRTGLTFRAEELLHTLELAQPTFKPLDAAGQLSEAMAVLADSVLPRRRIVFLTDLAAHSWDEPHIRTLRQELAAANCHLSIIDVSPSTPENCAIVRVNARVEASGTRSSLMVLATVANFSPQRISALPCTLYINGKKAASGFLDIPPYDVARKQFTCHIGEPGLCEGRIELPHDSLPVDDARFFTLSPWSEIRALIVDGEQSARLIDDEIFYLEKAMCPGTDVPSRIRPTAVTPEEFKLINLDEFDVLFLCNLFLTSTDDMLRLRNFLRSGGGVFVSLGRNVHPRAYNDVLGFLLPKRLRESNHPAATPLHISRVSREHPVMRVFSDADISSLRSAEFRGVFYVQPRAEPSAVEILSLKNDIPLMVEKRAASGRVILFLSTIDRDWNDLPIHTSFLPLMQEVVKYLSDSMDVEEGQQLMVGQRRRISPQDSRIPIVVRTPAGKSYTFSPGDNVVFAHTEKPGIYHVSNGTNFAVNLNAAKESDLRKADPKKIDSQLPEAAVASPDGGAGLGVSSAQALWGKLLLACLIFMLVETLLRRKTL